VAAYVYDDFRVTFAPRTDGTFAVRAVDSTDAVTTGSFAVPLSDEELRRAVHNLSRTADTRKAAPETRDVGLSPAPALDAEHLGGALADALFAGSIGPSYDAARQRAERAGRGLRLTLSLAAAPALLSVPWEFMYRRPRFLASQRNTPVVRVLESGSLDPPPTIASAVRMLGVIANPITLAPLDVAAERRRVEQTLARVSESGRVKLDWLEPATPRGLREALRDGSYHILHYAGHSDFTAAGEGMLFLEDSNGAAAAVDGTVLANLLGDQTDLRLVVLNSCEGARTTLTDPYAGVATTLIQLGVPAVVAMQFPISDRAAITFGEELFTNLIGRQDPIDAAVAEGRKAIYVEIDQVEWATPVLFLRDPEIELLRFALPPIQLALPDDERAQRASGRRRRRVLAVAGAAVAVAGAAIAGVLIMGDGGGDRSPAGVLEAADDRSHGYAFELEPADGPNRLWLTDSDLDNPHPAITSPAGDEIEPAWDPDAERLAFRRPDDVGGCQLCAVVPGVGDADGEPVAVVGPEAGRTQHAPAWQGTGGRGLFYAVTNDCDPGPGCAGEIHYVARPGDTASSEIVLSGLTGVVDLDVDPQDADRLLVVADDGATLRRDAENIRLEQSSGTVAASYTADGHRIFGIPADGRTLRIWDRSDGRLLDDPTIAELVEQYIAGGGEVPGLEPRTARALSVSGYVNPSEGPHTNVAVLIDDDNDADSPPVIAVVHIESAGSTGSIASVEVVPFSITDQGRVTAAAQ
jgi:CHAT domain-containing protein